MGRVRRAPSRSHESATVGAVAEATLLTLLLSSGFEVYSPVIDVGSDFLAVNPKGFDLRIQCKGRGADKQWLWDIRKDQLDQRHPPTHFYFIHGAPNTDDSWLVPSDVVKQVWTPLKPKPGTYRVHLTEKTRRTFQPFRKDAGIREARSWQPLR